MISIRSLLPILALSLLASAAAPANAAPVTVNGAQFDAPASCFLAEGALVCKLDGQQFELWITRKPLAPEVAPTESLANKMTYFSGVHENALATLLRTTGNESSTPFSSYGTYSALGALLPGKGAATSPAVRFASVLHAEEIWEFVEIVATRSPAIEALASALEASLKLPAAQPSSATATPVTSEAARATVATTTPTVAPNDNSPDATFNHKRLSLQYPTFLQPQVVEDSKDALIVQFKHTTRANGPHLTITLRPAQSTASATNNGKPASLIAARKAELTQAMAGKGASVEINSLGAIKGAGFAMIGEVAGTGVESIETNFASEINASASSAASVLSVRLTAEQKNAGEAQAAWGLLARTLSLRP
ncbi:MAG TPA: hypothetical protein PKN64_00760 [Casimicrobium sp.]|jgi:hypothetical protein|nr:hypothetical protein [Casimicrobium sp.]